MMEWNSDSEVECRKGKEKKREKDWEAKKKRQPPCSLSLRWSVRVPELAGPVLVCLNDFVAICSIWKPPSSPMLFPAFLAPLSPNPIIGPPPHAASGPNSVHDHTRPLVPTPPWPADESLGVCSPRPSATLGQPLKLFRMGQAASGIDVPGERNGAGKSASCQPIMRSTMHDQRLILPRP